VNPFWMMFISTKHIGLILVVIGTVWLAFSLSVKRQYSGEMRKAVDKFKKNEKNLLELTEVKIDRFRFWIGLLFIAIGTIMQW